MYASARNTAWRRRIMALAGWLAGWLAGCAGSRRAAGVPPISMRYSMENWIMKLNKSISAVFLAVALATTLGCASTATKEGTGEYVDDTVITTKVKAAIFNEPSLKSSEINVETFKGAVQLSGFVKYQADINKAVSIASGVKGVSSVKNDMRLK
jgi:hypothetical protein